MSLSRFQYSTVSPYYTSTTRTAGGNGPPGIVIDNFPGLRNGLASENASILARMGLGDGSNLGATWHLLLASLGCISCQTVNRTSSAPVFQHPNLVAFLSQSQNGFKRGFHDTRSFAE